MIDVNRMINLTKFQVQHKYKVTGIGENILTTEDINTVKSLKSGKEFVKLWFLKRIQII